MKSLVDSRKIIEHIYNQIEALPLSFKHKEMVKQWADESYRAGVADGQRGKPKEKRSCRKCAHNDVCIMFEFLRKEIANYGWFRVAPIETEEIFGSLCVNFSPIKDSSRTPA